MTFGILACALIGFVNSTLFFPHVTYLFPEGLEGNVYIFRGVPKGEKVEKQGADLTFRIPESRFLISEYVPNQSIFILEYFYVKNDGTRTPLEFEPSSLHDTSENRNNNHPFVWAPAEVSSSWAEVPCEVKYEEFYVGTRPHMLDRTQKERDEEYFRFKAFVEANAEVICEGKPKSKVIFSKTAQ
jgi:hypothetical protein